jgi:hypothetical protein
LRLPKRCLLFAQLFGPFLDLLLQGRIQLAQRFLCLRSVGDLALVGLKQPGVLDGDGGFRRKSRETRSDRSVKMPGCS